MNNKPILLLFLTDSESPLGFPFKFSSVVNGEMKRGYVKIEGNYLKLIYEKEWQEEEEMELLPIGYGLNENNKPHELDPKILDDMYTDEWPDFMISYISSIREMREFLLNDEFQKFCDAQIEKRKAVLAERKAKKEIDNER